MLKIAGSIITDCADGNARARQQLRFNRLFGVRPTFHGVGRWAPEIEAAGNLIDQLDALMNLPKSTSKEKAVILVNVAPRGSKVRLKWDNGVPFCAFQASGALIVTTYSEQILNMIAHKGIADSVQLFDVPTVTAAAVKWREITKRQMERINNTQFRSLEFLPLVAYWLVNGKQVPFTERTIETSVNTQGRVWCVDNFGNAKTTLTASDIDFVENKKVTLFDGSPAICHRRLADVPKGVTALVIGSSGYGDERFLEVVVQWQDTGHEGSRSAAERHNLSVGSVVLNN